MAIYADLSPLLTATVALLAGCYILLRVLAAHALDPREPPLAPSKVPILGYMAGLARHKFDYYLRLCQRPSVPSIFTVLLPQQKMYVVTRPDLFLAVQKQHRALSFDPIKAKFAAVTCGVGDEARAILDANVADVSASTEHIFHAHLLPGTAGLDDMNRVMLGEVASALDQLLPSSSSSSSSSGEETRSSSRRRLGLHAWLRDTLTQATARAVWGPEHPYTDPAVRDDFWAFESGLLPIILNGGGGSSSSTLFTSLVGASGPMSARDRVARAFIKYHEEAAEGRGRKHPGVSGLASGRYDKSVEYGTPAEDTARYEVGASIAYFVNTVPAAFWTLFFVYAEPGLLERVRVEVDSAAVVVGGGDAGEKKKRTLNITQLKQSCPLLLSTYQEVLRYASMGTSVREVTPDEGFQLGGYLLKKGAMLQMPSRIVHQDPALWGSDVASFRPERFLAENKAGRPRDYCFRAFGGGKTLCPGRHFASNEVLATVAAWLLRFDMRPAAGDWKMPTTKNTNVAAVIMEPDYDVEVEIAPRPGFEDVEWDIEMGQAGKMFAMVTEDAGDGSGQ